MGRGIALFAVLALLAGCSSSGGSGAALANPVDLISKASGCTETNGGPSGEAGLTGFLVAACDFPSGASLTVKTFKSNSDRDSDIQAGGTSDAVITGPKWVAYYYGSGNASDIASEMGGTVQH